jgi:hypothetical protein
MSKIFEEHRLKHDGRCVYLSSEGRRCRARAVWGGSMSSDSELMSEWVYIEVCQRHAEKVFPYDTDVLAARESP